MILLDSDVTSALMRLNLEPRVQLWLGQQVQEDLFVSTPTMFEIRYGIERKPLGRQRGALEAAFGQVFGSVLANRILMFDAAAAKEAAKARAAQIGRGNNVQVPDSQIAGVALAHGAAVATRNIKDFNGLGLTLIDPWA